MPHAAATDTWGISGPTFLLAYLAIAVVVGVAGLHARRTLAEAPAKRAPTDVASRPHDVAFLNGGAELAVCSALSAMHLRGTIAPSRGVVHAVGRLDPHAPELERAIHFTAATGVHRKRLPFHRPVATALAAMDQRLVAAGLLLPDEQRRRIRQVGTWMLAVAALGLVRLLAGVAEVKPVGFLVVALLVVTAIGLVQLVHAPRRTRLGDRTLGALRSEREDLSPKAKPDWVAYGPETAALGIGIYGTSALWASDPAFADELAMQRAAAGGSDGGSAAYFGSSDGGSSGSSGSSSDGGGGGGGCGGGGCGGG